MGATVWPIENVCSALPSAVPAGIVTLVLPASTSPPSADHAAIRSVTWVCTSRSAAGSDVSHVEGKISCIMAPSTYGTQSALHGKYSRGPSAGVVAGMATGSTNDPIGHGLRGSHIGLVRPEVRRSYALATYDVSEMTRCYQPMQSMPGRIGWYTPRHEAR